MLSPRFIPILQIFNRRLVKTVCFAKPSYVGDPLNAVKIFNDKEVDELIIMDISPGRFKNGPDVEYIEMLLSECQMPVGYGGGIRHAKDAQKIIALGAEKVIINSLLFDKPDEVAKISHEYGSQAVSISLDYKNGFWNGLKFYKNSGRVKVKVSVNQVIELIKTVACGEIIVHDIEHDGKFSGYNYKLLDALKDKIDLPVVICGGARNHHDLSEAIQKGAHSVAASSMFVFQGPHKAVLIQY